MATSRASPARAAVDHGFEELYRELRTDVYRAALRKLGNPHDAEDVTPAAFADAYRAVLRGAQPQSPRAWLLAISENVRRRRFRTAQRRPREELVDDADFPLAADLPYEQSHALTEALATLPPEQRRVFACSARSSGSPTARSPTSSAPPWGRCRCCSSGRAGRCATSSIRRPSRSAGRSSCRPCPAGSPVSRRGSSSRRSPLVPPGRSAPRCSPSAAPASPSRSPRRTGFGPCRWLLRRTRAPTGQPAAARVAAKPVARTAKPPMVSGTVVRTKPAGPPAPRVAARGSSPADPHACRRTRRRAGCDADRRHAAGAPGARRPTRACAVAAAGLVAGAAPGAACRSAAAPAPRPFSAAAPGRPAGPSRGRRDRGRRGGRRWGERSAVAGSCGASPDAAASAVARGPGHVQLSRAHAPREEESTGATILSRGVRSRRADRAEHASRTGSRTRTCSRTSRAGRPSSSTAARRSSRCTRSSSASG